MNQTMKHTLSILLCAMLLASTISCGSTSGDTESDRNTTQTETTETTNADTEETTEPNRLDALGAHDYSGSVYTVLDANPNASMHINIPQEEQTGEMINDTLWTRDVTLEDRYKLTIDYVQKTEGGADVLRSSVLAGDHAYNLVIGTAGISRLSHSTAPLPTCLTCRSFLSIKSGGAH